MDCPGSIDCAVYKTKRCCDSWMDFCFCKPNPPAECECVYARLPCEVGTPECAAKCDEATKERMIQERYSRDRERIRKENSVT